MNALGHCLCSVAGEGSGGPARLLVRNSVFLPSAQDTTSSIASHAIPSPLSLALALFRAWLCRRQAQNTSHQLNPTGCQAKLMPGLTCSWPGSNLPQCIFRNANPTTRELDTSESNVQFRGGTRIDVSNRCVDVLNGLDGRIDAKYFVSKPRSISPVLKCSPRVGIVSQADGKEAHSRALSMQEPDLYVRR
jgi:hypothetical protein